MYEFDSQFRLLHTTRGTETVLSDEIDAVVEI